MTGLLRVSRAERLTKYGRNYYMESLENQRIYSDLETKNYSPKPRDARMR